MVLIGFILQFIVVALDFDWDGLNGCGIESRSWR